VDSPPRPAGRTHLADLVTTAAARVPDHPAVVDVTASVTLTWAELDGAGSAEAARLRAHQVGPGDRVAIRLRNGAAYCVALIGALRAGAVAVPYGPGAQRAELEFVLADCRPTVLVAPPEDATAAAAAAARGVTLLDPPDLSARAEAGPAAPGGGEQTALLIYTSGSTGTPRGVQLAHRALLANREQTAGLRPAPVTPVDRVLLAVPLFHSYGVGAGFLQVCWAGATVVLTEWSDPGRLLEVIVEHRVSTVAGVPSTFRSLLELPAERLRTATAGLRLCTSGGAPLPPQLLAGFRAVTGLSIVEGYGLTEAGPVVTSNPINGTPKPGSVGRPLPGIELRLDDVGDEDYPPGPAVDEDTPPTDAGEYDFETGGDTGRIAIRGRNLFSGYWPDGAGGPDADGWFRTADVGFTDADGDLHLFDRSSDLVVVNGFSIYPREVEQVLLELPGVAEAAVVGVPDERTGQAVRAVLVRAADASVTAPEVLAHCAGRLARFKVPAVVEFAPALPRTPTGKIARRQLAGSAPTAEEETR
jgi:long-chain acyl-CoA synthetase